MKDIIENIDNAMKKGFITALILLVLEKESSHGYKIGKAIEERTLGVWKPPSSTLYTVLGNMDEKGLIDIKEEQEKSGRIRKIYEITTKGEEALKYILEKIITIKKSMMSAISTTLGIDEALIPEDFHEEKHYDILFSDPSERTNGEKLQILEFQKKRMTRQLEDHKIFLENIENSILELKNKLEDKTE